MSIEEFYEGETIAFRKKQKAEAEAFEAQLKERIIERFSLPNVGDKVTLKFIAATIKNVKVLEIIMRLPEVWVKVDTYAFLGVVDVPLSKIASHDEAGI